MRNIKLALFTTLIIISFLFGIKKFHNFTFPKNLKNEEKIIIKESLRVLKECFDLENKNQRTLNKSIELIEFCLEEYGK